MADLKAYDPKEVLITYGLTSLNSGLADDTFIETEFNADTFSLKVGVDGEATRTKSNNRSAKITITVMQSSVVNKILSAAHALDVYGSGVGPALVLPLMITDNSNVAVTSCPQAWVTKTPKKTFAAQANTRVWVFETNHMIEGEGTLVPS